MSEGRVSNKSWWQTTPSLLIAAAGTITVITGFVIVLRKVDVFESKSTTTLSAITVPQSTTKGPGNQPDLPSSVRKEEEPNNDFASANRISVGETITGRLDTEQDRDFFTFKAPRQSTGKIRVILRKLFSATVIVYDARENNVAERSEIGDKPIGFSFESSPGSDYYVMVNSFVGGRGDYELVVREE